MTPGNPYDRTRAVELKRQDYLAAQQCYFGSNAEPRALFESYVKGVGTYDDWLYHGIRQKIDSICATVGLTESTVFDSFKRIEKRYLERVAPELCEATFDVVPEGLVDTFWIALQTVNELRSTDIPTPNNMLMKDAVRPGFSIQSIENVELYVDPFRYQVLDPHNQWFVPAASSRSLSKTAIANAVSSAVVEQTKKHLVIIQDRFPGSNFSHFLYDWVTRIGHFCESGIVDPGDCLFVMGGLPGAFEELLIRALVSKYKLDVSSFFFPEQATVMRTCGRLYWFSDQVASYTHPAQMAFRRSVGIVRDVARSLRVESQRVSDRFEWIYISRADASRRRISNEVELHRVLSKLGFEFVVLSDHSVEDQIAIVQRSRCVVSAHGMGLTLVSLHLDRPALVELHQRGYGTDAYAFMARAMGFPYGFVMGNGGGNDFSVPLNEVLRALADVGVTEHTSLQRLPDVGRELTSDTIGSTLSHGAGLVAIAERGATNAPVPNRPLIKHTRVDPGQRLDTNVGAWTDLEVEGGRVYTASCWVWIPREFQGKSVMLSLGEWGRQRRVVADLSRTECWQLLQASRTAPVGVPKCHIVLRMDGPGGASVFSTGWRLDIGPSQAASVT